MKHQTLRLCLGIFIGYALIHVFKYLNTNLLWVFFYQG